MKEFTYTITDPVGIHARPAGMLAKKAAGEDEQAAADEIKAFLTENKF